MKTAIEVMFLLGAILLVADWVRHYRNGWLE